MANLPPLMPDWWKAPDTIEIGTEAIIDWFDMPVGSEVGPIPYSYTFYQQPNGDRDNGVDWYECMIVDVRCWLIPITGSDALAQVASLASLKNIYDTRVVKTYGALADYDNADDLTIANHQMGASDNNNLIYQMGRASRKLYVPNQSGGEARILWKDRVRLGLLEDKAVRDGTGDNIFYACKLEGTTPGGIRMDTTHAYVLTVATIPDDVSDDDWEFSSTMSSDREWLSRDFLAPQWDPIVGTRSVSPNAIGEASRWMINYYIEGTNPINQQPLEVRGGMSPTFFRKQPSQGVVSPNS